MEIVDSISKFWLQRLGTLPSPPKDTYYYCHANCEDFASPLELALLKHDNWVFLKCKHTFHATCMSMLRKCQKYQLQPGQCPICDYPFWEPYPTESKDRTILNQWLVREPSEMIDNDSQVPHFRYDDLLDICMVAQPGTMVHTKKSMYLVRNHESFELIHLDCNGSYLIPKHWVNVRGASYYDRMASFCARSWHPI